MLASGLEWRPQRIKQRGQGCSGYQGKPPDVALFTLFRGNKTPDHPDPAKSAGLHEGPTFQAQLGAGAAGADVIIVVHVDIKDQLTFQGFVCLGEQGLEPSWWSKDQFLG